MTALTQFYLKVQEAHVRRGAPPTRWWVYEELGFAMLEEAIGDGSILFPPVGKQTRPQLIAEFKKSWAAGNAMTFFGVEVKLIEVERKPGAEPRWPSYVKKTSERQRPDGTWDFTFEVNSKP